MHTKIKDLEQAYKELVNIAEELIFNFIFIFYFVGFSLLKYLSCDILLHICAYSIFKNI